jgi:hypothetical protein
MSIESHLDSLTSIGNSLEKNLIGNLMMGLEHECMQGEGGWFMIICLLITGDHFYDIKNVTLIINT